MQIVNSTTEDIDEIFALYRIASDYMKPRFSVYWPEFDRGMVAIEIAENRQWKMVIDGQTACVWATTFSDPQIWLEKNNDPAVYIHRIATSPAFRGRNLVAEITNWVKQYASANARRYIRMDTVGENQKLIQHYGKCGFAFLGMLQLKETDTLPTHYINASVSLFEMDIECND